MKIVKNLKFEILTKMFCKIYRYIIERTKFDKMNFNIEKLKLVIVNAFFISHITTKVIII